MASKRRNMFCKNKKQDTTEIIWPISSKQVFEMEDSEIRKLGNFSDKDICKLRDAAVSIMIPNPFQTVKEIELRYKERWRRISLGCKGIDSILGGGVPVRGITELSGESGVGKTQICLQLSLTVQYPIDMGGLDSVMFVASPPAHKSLLESWKANSYHYCLLSQMGQLATAPIFTWGAVYICTEDRFPSTRLHQILKEQSSNPQSRQPIPNLNFADRIYIDHVADVDSLKECIAVRLPRLLSNLKIGLVVLDSVAAVFRCDYEGLAQSNRRAHQIRMIAIKLHSLARTYNLAILAVNQVTANMDDGRSIPALGLTWANVVTTKLEVTAHRQPCLDSSWRELNLISAPDLPPASAIFCITSAGVSDVPQE